MASDGGETLTVITGASSGIGAALAAHVARPGMAVGLVGRNPDGLAATASAVSAAGGIPLIGRYDVTDPAMAEWMAEASAQRRLHAVYANAGVSAGPPSPGALETASDTERLVAANLLGAIATVRAAATVMRTQPERPLRRIGVVSSIAGVFPLADLAVYGATKAAVRQYAHAIRPRMKGWGITISVVCPGFVTSAMSARHHGIKPFEMPADRAARIMVRAVERGQRTCIFPLPFALLAALQPLGPGWLIDAITPMFSAEIAPDPRER